MTASPRLLAAALAVAVPLSAAATAGATWAPPVPGDSPLNASPSLDAVDVTAASVAGVPHVAWREWDGTNFEVRVAALTPAGWRRLGEAANPASPVNNDSLTSATSVALADVGGVPHVAWTERDGVNAEVRVARLSGDGSRWDRVGALLNPASPVNQAPDRDAGAPSITSVNGVPYVAWAEGDGTNDEIRVARLGAGGAQWDRVGVALNPESPLNRSATRSGRTPSIAGVGGVPHVAWAEDDGTNSEIRVARLNAAGTGWEHVGARLRPGSPVNQAANRDARSPSLADVGGVPHVAWTEATASRVLQVRVARLSSGGLGWERIGQARRPANPVNRSRTRSATAPSLAVVAGRPWVAWAEADGTNREVRVARLDPSGARWQEPVGGGSPINVSAGRDADAPVLTAIGEMPYVAWAERDAQNREARVARLVPRVLGLSAQAGEETLRFEARLRSYGLPFQVGFQVAGGGIARETRPGPLVGDPSLAVAGARGLRSGVTYQWRVYTVAGAGGLRVVGPSQVIVTTSVARLTVTPLAGGRPRAVRARAGARTGLAYRLNLRARVTAEIRRDGRVVRRIATGGPAGRNVVRFRAPARAGRYTIVLRGRAAGGRVDVAGARLIVRR
ncbi:MAG TPA: hypothetical protein VNT51_02730 [Miltoncostaeaceae bacterium]|nr:hypothetical protein [Miltoncostaeaceae bacterium]